jgi:hypothetical protein
VVVVAARNAWPDYKEIHAYVCQPTSVKLAMIAFSI